MSSLLQHKGPITRRGVHLRVYLAQRRHYDAKAGKWITGGAEGCLTHEVETEELISPDGRETTVAVLYEIIRKPRGMFGCWVVFRINGEDVVPDLSVPLALERLPRDARKLSPEERYNAWFKE